MFCKVIIKNLQKYHHKALIFYFNFLNIFKKILNKLTIIKKGSSFFKRIIKSMLINQSHVLKLKNI